MNQLYLIANSAFHNRLLAIAIGSVLSLLVSSVFFPLTTMSPLFLFVVGWLVYIVFDSSKNL